MIHGNAAVDVASKLVQGESLNLRGRNGAGKSRCCDHVFFEEEARGRNVRYLSRFTEETFVKEHAHSRVGDVLGGIRNAQDLIVRFGLVSLWYRRVSVLSTGETRKLYLAHAISSKNDLIILDQPYDGLDVHTRNVLRYMIEEISEGLAQMLVGTHFTKSCHGANGAEESTPLDSNEPTQVLLATNRPEEECMRDVETIDLDDPESVNYNVPDKDEWKSILVNDLNYSSKKMHERLISIEDLTVYSEDEEDTRFKILNEITWNVCRGETWVISGSNGSGKSSLMRNLLHSHERFSEGNSIVLIGPHSIETTDTLLPTINHDDLVCDVLMDSICKLLNLQDEILNRPLNVLSQGEFQMILFGRALMLRPDILLVDEGFHGLDKQNRSHILDILDHLSTSGFLTAVIISHHKDEWLPSSTHKLILHEGSVVRTDRVS